MGSGLEENRAWKWNREYGGWQRQRRGAGHSIFKIDWPWKNSIWKYLKTYFEVSEKASFVDTQERAFQAEKTANAKALWQKCIPDV